MKTTPIRTHLSFTIKKADKAASCQTQNGKKCASWLKQQDAKAGKKADKKAGKANQQVAANTSQEEQNAAHLSRLSGKEGVASNPQLRNRQAHQERLAEMEARTEQMRQAALERIKRRFGDFLKSVDSSIALPF